MLLRQDPGLEWKTRRVGSQGEKVPIFSDHASAGLGFLADDVAEDTTLLIHVILLRSLDLFGHVNRKNGQRNELRVRVLKGGASSLAVVFENQDVFETTVLLEVQDAAAECPEHVFNALGRKSGQAGIVVGSFNDDLMGADAIHAVKHTFCPPIEIGLDTECREFVGNYTHRPTRTVALERRSAVGVRAVGLDFRRSLGLVAVTERTETAFDPDCVTREV